jgi:HAD superfamily hydrolase (TIGR01509 family)
MSEKRERIFLTHSQSIKVGRDRMITDILWDFDGTLFDTYPVMVHSFRRALQDEGIEEEENVILQHMKRTVTETIAYYREKYSLSQEFSARHAQYEREAHESLLPPYPFAREVCKAVIKNGGRNYIITHRGFTTLKYLKYYKMDTYFTEIVTRRNGFKRKPDPESFLYLIDRYNIAKDRAIGVGDRNLDIEASKSAGIRACYFNTDGKSNYLADFNIASLNELLEIVGVK